MVLGAIEIVERCGVTVLHCDACYDHIAALTGQAVEWANGGRDAMRAAGPTTLWEALGIARPEPGLQLPAIAF